MTILLCDIYEGREILPAESFHVPRYTLGVIAVRKGIAVYPGLSDSASENLRLVERAVNAGITRLVLPLVLPYANIKQAAMEVSRLLRAANRYNMDVIVALTPEVLRILHLKHLSFRSLRIMGIRTLYVHKFSPKGIAELSRNNQHIRIQFNTAAVTEKTLEELLDNNPNIRQLEATFGVYPRQGTGLSEENLLHKTVLLHRAGISVCAFAACEHHNTPPLYDGSPTLEAHRGVSADLACRHLAAIGVDSVFLSDCFPTVEELNSLRILKSTEIAVKITPHTEDALQLWLLGRHFTARFDEARDAVRALEGEANALKTGENILPENNTERKVGDVTIDNNVCPEFMGELQIIKRNSPPNPGINVAASVRKEEAFLIKYILPGRNFRFLFGIFFFGILL